MSAPAISFELDGEQFIAVIAAGSRYSEQRGSALLIFGLGAGTVSASSPRLSVPAGSSASPTSPQGHLDREQAWPPASATSLGPFLSHDAGARVAYIELDAGGHGAGGLSFSNAIQ